MSGVGRYCVSVPMIGRISVVVQATSESDAIAQVRAGKWIDEAIDSWEPNIDGCHGRVCSCPRGVKVSRGV